MDRSIVPAIIIGLAVVASGYFLSTRSSTISTAPAVRMLQTSAEGKVKVTPDTLIISAWVELHNRQTQEIAYADMNTSINAVKAVLKNAWIEEKNVQTSGLSVWAEYSYTDGKQKQEGYQANTTLTIRVEKKDPKVTNDILDAIAKIKDIRMNGVDYDLADTEKAYTEARKMALEKARQKAEDMAKIAWVSIVSVQSISESIGGGPVPMYQNVRTMDMVGEAKSTSTDISLGQVEYTATVNVAYEIR